MRLPVFDYLEPAGLEEAARSLSETAGAGLLAGGTDLLVRMKQGVSRPELVVNLKKIAGLDYVRLEGGSLVIGCLTRLKQIWSEPLIQEWLPALAMAASSVGSYHHQVMGTIGGNLCQETRCHFFNQSAWWRSAREACLKTGGSVCHAAPGGDSCHACYLGDLAPLLIALEAQAELMSANGIRLVRLEEVYTCDGRRPLGLGPDEILTRIIVGPEVLAGRAFFLKFADRLSLDFPVVSLALWFSPDRKEYRTCLSGVGPGPVRAEAAEDYLSGREPTAAAAAEAGGLAAEAVRTIGNAGWPPAYQKRLAGELLARLIMEAAGSLNK